MKRAKSIAVASILTASMLASSVVGFAADYDLKHKTDPAKNTKILTILKKANRDQFKEVARNMKDYYIEYGGKDFELKAYDAKWTEAVSKHPDLVKDGKITEKMIFGFEPMPAEATIAPLAPSVQEFEVTEISAITRTQVEVVFKAALAEDVKGAKLNVIDNNGAKVEVVAQDLSKGAAGATFLFVKALDKNPEGKWMVNGVVKDFDLLKKLKAVKDAGDDQLKLKAALEALEIKNIDVTKYPAYAKKNKENLAGYQSVAEVQKMVDDVNMLNEDAVVKAVLEADAANNAVALAAALSNAAFVKVNPEWAAQYLTNIVLADDTIAKIQAKVYAGNDVKLAPPVLTVTGIDRDKLEKSKQLVVDYADMKVDGVTPKNAAVAGRLKAINIQLALCDVLDAATPATLEAKIAALRALDPVNLTEEYIAENANDYIEAIAKAAEGNKDAVGDLNIILTNVHLEFGKLVVKENKGIKGTAAARPEFVIQALNKKGEPFILGKPGSTVNAISLSGIDGIYGEKVGETLATAPHQGFTLRPNANIDLSDKIGQTLNIDITFTVAASVDTDLDKEYNLSTTLKVLAADIDAGESEKDLKADKTTYEVGDTMTFTFTLKDAAGNVVDMDGTSEVLVKKNGAADLLAKDATATIAKGKVTVTAVANKVEAATQYDLFLLDLDPALKVTSGAVQTVTITAGEITRFKAEKGTAGVKLTAYTGTGNDTANNVQNIVLKDVQLTKLGTPNVEQTLELLISGGAVINTGAAGVADNLFTTKVLAVGTYELSFTYQGQAFKFTFVV